MWWTIFKKSQLCAQSKLTLFQRCIPLGGKYVRRQFWWDLISSCTTWRKRKSTKKRRRQMPSWRRTRHQRASTWSLAAGGTSVASTTFVSVMLTEQLVCKKNTLYNASQNWRLRTSTHKLSVSGRLDRSKNHATSAACLLWTNSKQLLGIAIYFKTQMRRSVHKWRNSTFS